MPSLRVSEPSESCLVFCVIRDRALSFFSSGSCTLALQRGKVGFPTNQEHLRTGYRIIAALDRVQGTCERLPAAANKATLTGGHRLVIGLD